MKKYQVLTRLKSLILAIPARIFLFFLPLAPLANLRLFPVSNDSLYRKRQAFHSLWFSFHLVLKCSIRNYILNFKNRRRNISQESCLTMTTYNIIFGKTFVRVKFNYIGFF